jgi:7-carboxy-7-deazaguanine synthase
VSDLTLSVCELFYSIQGESTYSGLPCCFIRLAGCNLRCSYCDSAYSWQEPEKKTAFGQIFTWLAGYPATMVEITGGEPLLQENIYPLMERLLSQGRRLLLETNGSCDIGRVPTEAVVILDLKCPDSGMTDQNDWSNIEHLRQRRLQGGRDEIKFVLASEKDFHWAREIMTYYRLEEIAAILFSPVREQLAPAELARFMLDYRVPARLQLQLHTLLWPEKNRGV